MQQRADARGGWAGSPRCAAVPVCSPRLSRLSLLHKAHQHNGAEQMSDRQLADQVAVAVRLRCVRDTIAAASSAGPGLSSCPRVSQMDDTCCAAADTRRQHSTAQRNAPLLCTAPAPLDCRCAAVTVCAARIRVALLSRRGAAPLCSIVNGEITH